MPGIPSPLDNIKIASPCSADCNEMYGNDRMRFCGQCKLNVYNLSGMTRDEAENLVMNAEGRLCVRFYRRLDCTIITENCPVGWARVKQRAKIHLTAAFSMVLGLLSGLSIVSPFTRPTPNIEVGVLPVRPTPTPIQPPDRYQVVGGFEPSEMIKQMPQSKNESKKKTGKRPSSRVTGQSMAG